MRRSSAGRRRVAALALVGTMTIACSQTPGAVPGGERPLAKTPAVVAASSASAPLPVPCPTCACAAPCPTATHPGVFTTPFQGIANVDEWLRAAGSGAQRERAFLAVVYEELVGDVVVDWLRLRTYVRVSVRASGAYQIDVAPGDRFPSIRPFYRGSTGGEAVYGAAGGRFEPCDTPYDGAFYAQAFHSVAEAGQSTSWSSWTSPDCPGFPTELRARAWDLVERATGGALRGPTQ